MTPLDVIRPKSVYDINFVSFITNNLTQQVLYILVTFWQYDMQHFNLLKAKIR